MPRDEYNSVNISNDRQVTGNEFGNFSRNEYSFSSENAINKSELNVTNKDEINDISEISHKEADDIDKSLSQRDRDLIEDAANSGNGETVASSSSSSSASSASTSSSASSAGGAASSSSAASSASAAASTAAASATAASAVVVTAFAVVAAAPIILSNAHINEDTFKYDVSETEIFYYLDLEEVFEDEIYSVTISYEKYTDTQQIVEGENEGHFVGLEPNTTYDFMVTEGSKTEISRILYKEKITTAHYVEPEPEPEPQGVSEVRGATVSTDADLVNNRFTVTLDYVDDLGKFSDFDITLTRVEQTAPTNGLIHRAGGDGTTGEPEVEQLSSKTFSLEKTTQAQTIDAGNDFRLSSGSFTYSLSYIDSDNPDTKVSIPTESNTISFVDNEHESVVRGATLYESADLDNNIVTVNLDFTDDYQIIKYFTLTLIDDEQFSDNPDVEPTPQIWTLEKKVGNQDVRLNDGEHDIVLLNKLFSFMISYGTTDSDVEQIASSGRIIFTDPTYESTFRSATLYEEADFRDEELPVTVNLDFVDDYDRFSQFELHLQEYMEEPDPTGWEPEELVYTLLKQTGDQVVKLNDGMHETGIDDRSFNYSITYYSSETESTITAASGVIKFVDPTYKSVINEAYVSPTISYTNKTISVYLDYQDDYGYFHDFEVLLSRDNPDTGATEEYTLRFNASDVDETTHLVPITFSDVQEGSYSYTITYRSYASASQDDILTAGSGTVSFDDPNWVPSTAQVNGLTFLYADYESRTITVQLDYSDPDGFLGAMELTIMQHSDNSIYRQYSTTADTFELNNQPQTLSLEVEDNDSFEGGIDVSSTDGFDYTLSYYDNGEQQLIHNDNLTIQDYQGLVNGLDYKFVTKTGDSTKAYANSGDETFEFYANYNNYFANLDWSGFQLDISDGNFEESDVPGQTSYSTARFSLNTDTGGWRTYHFTDSELDQIDLLLSDSTTYHYRITYFASAEASMSGDDYRSTLVESTISFIDELMPEINSVSVGNLVSINSDFCYFPIKFTFGNPNSNFNDLMVTVKTNDSSEISVNAATYSGLFYKDSDWQVGSISGGSLDELGINENNPSESATLYVYYGDQTAGGGDAIYTQTITLTLEGENDAPTVHGIRFEDMLIVDQNDMYEISVDHLIFTGLFDTRDAYKPIYVFTIHSGSGSMVGQPQNTVFEQIPEHMDANANVILGPTGNFDDYFDLDNSIVISVSIQWSTESNDTFTIPLISEHTFYKQA